MGKRKDPKQLAKLMSYVLGRQPDEFGLVLDKDGFVRVKDLIKAISEEPGWGFVRKSHVHEVLITFRDNPFAVENDCIKVTMPDGGVSVVAGVTPPKLLYHCVRRKAYPVVCQKGIIPMGHHHVFLATTEDLALRIGKRRDPKPVLLTVQAERAFKAGVKFSRQGELIYLVDQVPVGYFSGPPIPKEKKEPIRPKKEAPFAPDTMPGSFTLDMERSQRLQMQKSKALKKKGIKKEIAWKKDTRRFRRKHK